MGLCCAVGKGRAVRVSRHGNLIELQPQLEVV
jgi:hypothetical protein